MRVLLNINSRELNSISGDTSYYKNLTDFSDESLEISLVGRKGTLLREARKILEKCSSIRIPDKVNEFVFKCSRYIYIPRIDTERADIILSNVLFPFIPDRRQKKKIPIIWSIQGINPPHYYQSVGSADVNQVINMTNYFAERASVVLVWTRSGAESLKKYCRFSTPVRVLPPMIRVNLPKKKLKKESRLHLLFIGREPERKGLYDALKAFHEIKGISDELTFDIVSKLSGEMIRTIKDEPKINYFEDVTDEMKSQLLERADILILPTYAETYGYVLVEGMAHGCAIITSNYMPLNELVENGRNGILVGPGDVDNIADAILTLINDSHMLKTLKDNNIKKYMKEFNPDVLIPQYKELFQSINDT
ncbi:MAG: glycosyltransferase family 4 protein [Nitrospirae bacterium]|nr:glycosyltransferase family 4 protein [Nitrospirota bacterium]